MLHEIKVYTHKIRKHKLLTQKNKLSIIEMNVSKR